MEESVNTGAAKLHTLFEKHTQRLRFFALLISGIALGLIFNAICRYQYSSSLLDRVRNCFAPPFDGADSPISVFRVILSSSGVDIVLILLIYLFGLTYICRQGCSAILILRGVALGVSVGVLASSAASKIIETEHPVVCSVCFLGAFCAVSVLFVLVSCFAQRASVLFRGLSERSSNMIFTARFAAYALACAASVGAVILLKAIYLLLIYLFTK